MRIDLFNIYTRKLIIYIVVFLFIILLFLVLNNTKKDSYDVAQEETVVKNNSLVENFDDIEASMTPTQKYELIIKWYKEQIRQKEKKITSQSNINYKFYPENIEKILINSNKISDIWDLLFTKLFKDFNLVFDVEFIKDDSLLRARYQNNTIKIFNINKLSREESLSVFIHELWHYFDIKFLEKQVFYDLSEKFYELSWQDTKILKNNSDKNDFVSWYAMTNKYEDFAESFTFYVLFNADFKQKASKSNILEEKYNFFSKYIFKNDEFKKTNFRKSQEMKEYNWDTTKIDFLVKNFLDYLKKWI